MKEFSDEVARLCYEHFERVLKRKPKQNKEWTLLSAVIKSDIEQSDSKKLEIISMATGTKCLGYSELSQHGDILFDSHAEVLARRGLIKYILHHMELLLNDKESNLLCFNKTMEKFSLKSSVKFHFFTTQVPCGDAAIFPKSANEDNCEIDVAEKQPKKIKLDNTIYKAEKTMDRTYDIYRCPFDESAMQRAVISRLSGISNLPLGFYLNKPAIYQSSLMFEHSKEIAQNREVPSSKAIIWCKIGLDSVEVSVNGKKQGVTKKNFNKPSVRISICKAKLFENFLHILSLLPARNLWTQDKENPTYLDYKNMSKSYQQAKQAVFNIFDKWKKKPDIFQQFSIFAMNTT